ncbi:hypothetical protein F5876DRAFT_68661 [Lentinula aff. lateritia]|uniref:Uncharacterized protein n=1 Tax=Lentinula aff. lateritia TaxID=2804960 RepID=A0ACC1TQ85_9AGAR|nr:hypothetical protein F5876DRAFT_68661 [Lentinula aff. lateritia]
MYPSAAQVVRSGTAFDLDPEFPREKIHEAHGGRPTREAGFVTSALTFTFVREGFNTTPVSFQFQNSRIIARTMKAKGSARTKRWSSSLRPTRSRSSVHDKESWNKSRRSARWVRENYIDPCTWPKVDRGELSISSFMQLCCYGTNAFVYFKSTSTVGSAFTRSPDYNESCGAIKHPDYTVRASSPLDLKSFKVEIVQGPHGKNVTLREFQIQREISARCLELLLTQPDSRRKKL